MHIFYYEYNTRTHRVKQKYLNLNLGWLVFYPTI